MVFKEERKELNLKKRIVFKEDKVSRYYELLSAWLDNGKKVEGICDDAMFLLVLIKRMNVLQRLNSS